MIRTCVKASETAASAGSLGAWTDFDLSFHINFAVVNNDVWPCTPCFMPRGTFGDRYEERIMELETYW